MKTWTKRTIAVCLLLALFLTAIPCASAKQYTDVTRSALPDYFDAINYVTDNGIMNGVSTSSFSPNEMVTRAMFITTLYRYAGSPSSFAAVSFTDISSSHYAYNAVKWGVKYNIVTGTTTTTFSPDEQVTREQAMTFLWRYLKNYVGGTPYYYGSISGCGDYSSIYDYARTPMYWAVSNAIIFASGSSKLLYPKAGVYRKELALWITRYGCNVDGIRFGKDNFSFTNSKGSFRSFDKKRLLISSSLYKKLEGLASRQEQEALKSQLRNLNGVCYGMCVSVLLDKRGMIAVNENSETNCKTMYAVPAPKVEATTHKYVKDKTETSYSFPQVENVIDYFQLAYQLGSVLKHHKFDIPSVSSTNALLQDLRTYGMIILSFFWDEDDGTHGHAILLFGMPKLASDGGYDISFYDPNSKNKKTMHISSDLTTYSILFNGKTVSPARISYDADFYRYIGLDLDGDYNLSIMKAKQQECMDGKMWLAVDVDGEFRIENREGQVLRYANFETNGDMPVSNMYIKNNFDDTSLVFLEVPESESISVKYENSATAVYAIWNTGFQKLFGKGIQEVYFTPDSTEMRGKAMDYELRFFQENDTQRLLSIKGTGAEELNLAENEGCVNIFSDTELAVSINEDYTQTILEESLLPQSELYINHLWGEAANIVIDMRERVPSTSVEANQ